MGDPEVCYISNQRELALFLRLQRRLDAWLFLLKKTEGIPNTGYFSSIENAEHYKHS